MEIIVEQIDGKWKVVIDCNPSNAWGEMVFFRATSEADARELAQTLQARLIK